MFDRTQDRAVMSRLRALAILNVLFFHIFFSIVRFIDAASLQDFVNRMPAYLNFGWQPHGVDILFFASALLLGSAMIGEHQRTGCIDTRRYFERRVIRIVPLYIAAVLIFGLAQGAPFREIALSAFFIGYLAGNSNVIPVGWSMETIVLFYLILPVVMQGLFKSKNPLYWLSLAVVASVAARYVFAVSSGEEFKPLFGILLETGEPSYAFFELYFRPWFRLPAFSIGLWLAFFLSANQNSEWRKSPVLIAAGTLLIVAVCWTPIHDETAWIYQVTGEGFWLAYWAFAPAFVVLGCASLVAAAPGPNYGIGFRVLDRLLQPIGRLLFAVFLFHMPMIAVAAVIVLRGTDKTLLNSVGAGQVIAIFLLATMLTAIFSMVLIRYVEKPIQRVLKSKLFGEKAPPV